MTNAIVTSLHRPLAVILSLLWLSASDAEIRSFSGLIEAASSYIHFSDGYLVAPGYVDLNGLVFSTLDYIPDEDINDDANGMDDDEDEDGNGGGNRSLDEIKTGSAVDIVFFHEVRLTPPLQH